jgi:hypothetical protein
MYVQQQRSAQDFGLKPCISYNQHAQFAAALQQRLRQEDKGGLSRHMHRLFYVFELLGAGSVLLTALHFCGC